jgi:hypothetical protein
LQERGDGEAEEQETPARQVVDDVRVGGEKGEVHRQPDVAEKEQPGGGEVGPCQDREQPERDADESAEQQREEQLGVVARGEGGRRDDRVTIASSRSPHRVAQRNSGPDALDSTTA